MAENSIFDELWQSYSVKAVIIDDDPGSVDLVQRYIKVAYPHVEVLGATDGAAGLKLIEENIPDLVLLDIQMPELSGLEVLKKIKQHIDVEIASVPVIMVTVVKDKAVVNDAIESGAVNYILKPYNRKDLVRRVKPYLFS